MIENTIADIEVIIGWWQTLEKDYGNINDIDYSLQKLTGLNYFYSAEVSGLNKSYLFAYVRRRVGVARSEIKNYANHSQGKSATIALSENEALYIDEVEKEANFSEHRVRLSAISKVIDAMRQRISNLKNEQNARV